MSDKPATSRLANVAAVKSKEEHAWHIGRGNLLAFPDAEKEDDEVTKRSSIPESTDEIRPEIVQLSADGSLIAGNGSEDFAAAVAYTARMADLIGEMLGVEHFTSMEFSLSNGACVVSRAASGELCAAKGGTSYDISVLRDAAHVA